MRIDRKAAISEGSRYSKSSIINFPSINNNNPAKFKIMAVPAEMIHRIIFSRRESIELDTNERKSLAISNDGREMKKTTGKNIKKYIPSLGFISSGVRKKK